MTRTCLALLSGGLDSILAVRLMQQQGIRVEAFRFVTPLSCRPESASLAAERLNTPLTSVSAGDDYLRLLQKPRFGFGRGANPCVDCRIYMLQLARREMLRIQADFLVSGEVLGQRPMSQKRADLETIATHADVADLLLRPLSAKLLRPTRPEREGWVDRGALYGFSGSGRKGLIRLARELGVPEIPPPFTGCLLTETPFAAKAFDLLEQSAEASWWDYELLRYGRHFRFSQRSKAVVGRNQSENESLRALHQRPEGRSLACLSPVDFRGPRVLLVGDEPSLVDQAAALLWRFRGKGAARPACVEVLLRGQDRQTREVTPDARIDALPSLTAEG